VHHAHAHLGVSGVGENQMGNTVCEKKVALFTLGKVVMTQGVCALLKTHLVIPPLLQRHVTGDFGDLCESDIEVNNEALETKDMILSSYVLEDVNNLKVYVITDAGHETTTVLLPSEY